MSADQRIVSHADFKVSPAQSGEGVHPYRGSDPDLESRAPDPRARAEAAARAANAALTLRRGDRERAISLLGVRTDPIGGVTMSSTVDESPCPQCGHPVPVTITSPEPGDQLAADQVECPGCGIPLRRDIDGHADLGWRLANESGT